jgi:hypothetical protein
MVVLANAASTAFEISDAFALEVKSEVKVTTSSSFGLLLVAGALAAAEFLADSVTSVAFAAAAEGKIRARLRARPAKPLPLIKARHLS